MKYRNTQLEWFTCGFVFSTDYQHVVLIEKRKQWCYGLHNGVGGSIEETDASPLDAHRREFVEETGLNLQNWEFFCQLTEPKAVVEFFRATAPFKLLQQIRTTTNEEVVLAEVENLHERKLMPNLAWLLPMAMSSGGLICNVTETMPQTPFHVERDLAHAA